MKGLKAAIEFIFVYLVIRRGALFLAWNPVAWLCCLPLRSALSAKAIHQRIDTFIRRPNTSRPEYLRHCCRSLHFSLIGDFDQIFIFAPELLEVQATHLSICGSICHILTSQAIYLEIRINTLIGRQITSVM